VSIAARILLLTVGLRGRRRLGENVSRPKIPSYSSEWIETAWATIKEYLAPAVLGRPLFRRPRGLPA